MDVHTAIHLASRARSRQVRVISFVRQKGGVAKSTTALGLACTAVTRGKNAAVLDMDPQASAAEWAEHLYGSSRCGSASESQRGCPQRSTMHEGRV